MGEYSPVNVSNLLRSLLGLRVGFVTVSAAWQQLYLPATRPQPLSHSSLDLRCLDFSSFQLKDSSVLLFIPFTKRHDIDKLRSQLSSTFQCNGRGNTANKHNEKRDQKAREYTHTPKVIPTCQRREITRPNPSTIRVHTNQEERKKKPGPKRPELYSRHNLKPCTHPNQHVIDHLPQWPMAARATYPIRPVPMDHLPYKLDPYPSSCP